MLETVLMRTFMMLYVSDFEGDDDRYPYESGKSSSAERRAYTTLASVCWYWRQTLTGWPQSPTRKWFRHQIKQFIEREYIHVYIIKCKIKLVYLTVMTAKWQIENNKYDERWYYSGTTLLTKFSTFIFYVLLLMWLLPCHCDWQILRNRMYKSDY